MNWLLMKQKYGWSDTNTSISVKMQKCKIKCNHMRQYRIRRCHMLDTRDTLNLNCRSYIIDYCQHSNEMSRGVLTIDRSRQ